MLIEADFSAVPDVVLPITPGIYDFQVIEVTTKQPKNPETKGTNVIVKLVVHSDGPNKGRFITDYIFVSRDPNQSVEERNRGLVPLKRLALAAGIPLTNNGLNVMDIQGKIVKAQVNPNVYKDASGVTKESTNIGKYFIPGDAELNVSSGVTNG
jgi:hypothetical protein